MRLGEHDVRWYCQFWARIELGLTLFNFRLPGRLNFLRRGRRLVVKLKTINQRSSNLRPGGDGKSKRLSKQL
ncbi:MAG TPA: hypothetical protein VMN60_11795 [Longimicrobiales bacterium]|nr:hypothetical protein [Longimicrobiales bacterium]